MVAPAGITTRQMTVIELIASGNSNKEIAQAMGITEAGVKKHIEALMRRYGVRRRTALVQRAIRSGDLRLGSLGSADSGERNVAGPTHD